MKDQHKELCLQITPATPVTSRVVGELKVCGGGGMIWGV